MFEEFIDINNKKFFVKTLGENKYLAFAYDEKVIYETITNAGLEIGNVKRIYFSQIEFLESMASMNTPYIKIDDITLSLVSDILVKIPANIKIASVNKIDLQNITLSKHSISINSTSKYINNKTANILTVFLFLLSALFFVKTFVNYQIIEDYETKISEIKQSTNNPLSSLQLQSIIKKYDRKFSKQVKIRELFKYVLNIKQQFSTKIIAIEYENNTIKLKIKDNPMIQSLETKIEKFIQKKYKKSTVKKRTEYLIVEVSL